MHVDRWFSVPAPEEGRLLDLAVAPVLDVGCGPGRHTAALLRRGVAALGVDISPLAVRIARDRGARAIRRSVFDPLPSEGAWSTALLVDGNIGIGGDPARLLRRLAGLLSPGGRVLAEVERPGTPTTSLRVRVEIDGDPGGWFPWAQVAADGVARVAGDVGFEVRETWEAGGRWFAWLARRP